MSRGTSRPTLQMPASSMSETPFVAIFAQSDIRQNRAHNASDLLDLDLGLCRFDLDVGLGSARDSFQIPKGLSTVNTASKGRIQGALCSSPTPALCDVRYCDMALCYCLRKHYAMSGTKTAHGVAPAMLCPVLSLRMLLPAEAPRLASTVHQVTIPVTLSAYYAMSGTDKAYSAISLAYGAMGLRVR
eukprot:70552-Rhodomonas_salina.3